MTIIPRGRALGVTMQLPVEDRYSHDRDYLLARVAVLMGGRIAEEVIFGPEHVTTGASNDIEKATEIARNMVTKWGLSEKLGPLTYREDENEVFLGHAVTQRKDVSDATNKAIDAEVRGIIDRAYNTAREALEANLDGLHIMAKALMKYETIDDMQIQEILAGKEPSPPADWVEDNGKNGKSDNQVKKKTVDVTDQSPTIGAVNANNLPPAEDKKS